MKKFKSLLTVFFYGICSLACATGGYDAECVDPATGMLDADKLMGPDYKGPAFQPYVADSEVTASIHADGDNKIVVTMKDGSKHVFERDPFLWNRDGTLKKSRPWVQVQ